MDTAKSLSILFIGYLAPFSALVPLVLSWYRYTRLPAAFRIVSAYLLLSLVSSIIVAMLASRGINNMPVMHVYTFAEFMLLCLFFAKVHDTPAMHQSIALAMDLFVLFFLAEVLLKDHLFGFNNYAKSLEAFLVAVFCLIYFIRSLEFNVHQARAQAPVTYVVAGLLLYFMSSLALFVTLNINPQYVAAQLVIWNTHAALLLLMFILFTVGLWKYR